MKLSHGKTENRKKKPYKYNFQVDLILESDDEYTRIQKRGTHFQKQAL